MNMSSNDSQKMPDLTTNNKSANLGTNPIDQIPITLSEDEMKSRIDAIIKKWEQGINEKKSLLYLLTTLHEVWGSNSNLGNISMQDLLENKSSVRTYYKKAMRELHPDKNKDQDFKTKYTASCLYQILNEANATYIG